jgi:hypothetical protein
MMMQGLGRRRLVRTAAILAIVAVGVPLCLSQLGSTSLARFGASEPLGPNELAAATLSVKPGAGTVPLSVIGMTPGDSVSGRVDLVNDGSLPLRYSLELSLPDSTNGSSLLAEALHVELWHATNCGTAPPTVSAILVPNRPLASATQLFGDPAPGQDPGDRPISVGRVDTICYRVRLPTEVANGAQSQRLTQAFVVRAEHAVPIGDSP